MLFDWLYPASIYLLCSRRLSLPNVDTYLCFLLQNSIDDWAKTQWRQINVEQMDMELRSFAKAGSIAVSFCNLSVFVPPHSHSSLPLWCFSGFIAWIQTDCSGHVLAWELSFKTLFFWINLQSLWRYYTGPNHAVMSLNWSSTWKNKEGGVYDRLEGRHYFERQIKFAEVYLLWSKT